MKVAYLVKLLHVHQVSQILLFDAVQRVQLIPFWFFMWSKLAQTSSSLSSLYQSSAEVLRYKDIQIIQHEFAPCDTDTMRAIPQHQRSAGLWHTWGFATALAAAALVPYWLQDRRRNRFTNAHNVHMCSYHANCKKSRRWNWHFLKSLHRRPLAGVRYGHRRQHQHQHHCHSNVHSLLAELMLRSMIPILS